MRGEERSGKLIVFVDAGMYVLLSAQQKMIDTCSAGSLATNTL